MSASWRLVRLFAGLVLFGVGLAMMVVSDLGLAPWDVLHQGISIHTGIGIGTAGIIVGLVVLLGWIPLKQRVGWGTVANIVVVGIVLDLTLLVMPHPDPLWLRAAVLVAGVLIIGYASGLYIGAGLGPGVRDGLMTGLADRGINIGVARFGIEAVVLIGGWLLGGTVGIGTVLFAVALGPLVAYFLPRLTVVPRGRSASAQA